MPSGPPYSWDETCFPTASAPAALETPEPAPAANATPPIWDLVIADMRARDAFGRKKYGTPLQAGNGRRMLVDAYQEVLDLAVYVRGELAARERWQLALVCDLADYAHRRLADVLDPAIERAMHVAYDDALAWLQERFRAEARAEGAPHVR